MQFVGNGHWGLGAGRAGIGDRTPVKAGACDSVSDGPARRISLRIDHRYRISRKPYFRIPIRFRFVICEAPRSDVLLP